MPPSERCRSCENCLQYYEFESIKIRKTREKERKKRGLVFPCTVGTVTKKQRLTEAETLNAYTMGRQYRSGDVDATFLATNVPTAEVRPRPAVGELSLPTYDTVAFGKFKAAVERCEAFANVTNIAVVKADAPTVLKSLRYALSPSIDYDEVDYGELLEEANFVLNLWTVGRPVGDDLFCVDIPMTDVTYQRRDGCAAQFHGSWGCNGL